MIFIAHRGNTNGKKPELENQPAYIEKALENGYHVEIDVWYKKQEWFLGHDTPEYKVKQSFLLNSNLWCHAKSIETLKELTILGAHCFWHQTDDVVLTSNNYLWTFPGKKLTSKSIAVQLENCNYSNQELRACSGMCSDNIKKYKEILNG